MDNFPRSGAARVEFEETPVGAPGSQRIGAPYSADYGTGCPTFAIMGLSRLRFGTNRGPKRPAEESLNDEVPHLVPR